MSEAKVSLINNPFHMPEDDQLVVKDFQVQMFKLIPGDDNGDRMRYEKFMMKVFPYDKDSKIEIIATNKNWTKEGALIICLEYVEIDNGEPETPDTREY